MTRRPFRIQCEQYHLSRALAAGLEQEAHAEVRFNRRLLSFEDDGKGAQDRRRAALRPDEERGVRASTTHSICSASWVRCSKQGASVDRIAHWERRRRIVTHAFTQAQTIANMEHIKVGSREAHARRRATMQALHDDPVKRRAYLKRQAMFESLEHAAQVA